MFCWTGLRGRLGNLLDLGSILVFYTHYALVYPIMLGFFIFKKPIPVGSNFHWWSIGAGCREGQRGIQRNSQDNEVLWSRLHRLPHTGLHGAGATRTSWTSKADLVANVEVSHVVYGHFRLYTWWIIDNWNQMGFTQINKPHRQWLARNRWFYQPSRVGSLWHWVYKFTTSNFWVGVYHQMKLHHWLRSFDVIRESPVDQLTFPWCRFRTWLRSQASWQISFSLMSQTY